MTDAEGGELNSKLAAVASASSRHSSAEEFAYAALQCGSCARGVPTGRVRYSCACGGRPVGPREVLVGGAKFHLAKRAVPDAVAVNPVFAALGIGMKDEMSHMEWQQWANLGTMSTKSAAAKFLYELSKFHPGIFDESFESDGKTLSVKSAVRILAAYIINYFCCTCLGKNKIIIL